MKVNPFDTTLIVRTYSEVDALLFWFKKNKKDLDDHQDRLFVIIQKYTSTSRYNVPAIFIPAPENLVRHQGVKYNKPFSDIQRDYKEELLTAKGIEMFLDKDIYPEYFL